MCGMNLAFDRELIGPALYFGLMVSGPVMMGGLMKCGCNCWGTRYERHWLAELSSI